MIPLYKPYIANDVDLSPILFSGKLNVGKWGEKLEHMINEYLSTKNVCLVNNYNLAFHILFNHLKLKHGDKVALSPLACLESTMPVKSYGLEIVWVDIDPNTGTLLPESLEKILNENDIKAVLHNHFCGNPGHIDEIRKLTTLHSITLIDDGIECFGSEYKLRKIGNNTADYSIFSLSYVRIPNCLQGAAIVTNNYDDYKQIKIITDNGIDRNNFRDLNGEIKSDIDITNIGYSGVMSEVNAYLGVKSMENIHTLLNIQKINSSAWEVFIKKHLPDAITFGDDIRTPNYWVFGVITNKKKELINYLNSVNIKTSSVHTNNNSYSVFSNKETLKNVDYFMDRFVALPCGWWVNSSDIISLVDANINI